jgi:hypothetical protein
MKRSPTSIPRLQTSKLPLIKWKLSWQHTFQTNWVSQYSMWVDNSGDMDEFDLEPNNVQMEIFGQRVQEEEVVEEEAQDSIE